MIRKHVEAKANEFIIKYGNGALDIAFECRFISCSKGFMESTLYWSAVAAEVIDILEGDS